MPGPATIGRCPAGGPVPEATGPRESSRLAGKSTGPVVPEGSASGSPRVARTASCHETRWRARALRGRRRDSRRGLRSADGRPDRRGPRAACRFGGGDGPASRRDDGRRPAPAEEFRTLTLDCAAAALVSTGLREGLEAMTGAGQGGRPAGSPACLLAAADAMWHRLAGPACCLGRAPMREFAAPVAGTADTPFRSELSREIRRAAARLAGPRPEPQWHFIRPAGS